MSITVTFRKSPTMADIEEVFGSQSPAIRQRDALVAALEPMMVEMLANRDCLLDGAEVDADGIPTDDETSGTLEAWDEMIERAQKVLREVRGC